MAHICALVSVVAAVNDHKANTTLTYLRLDNNKVADAGATALAEALKATVWTFGQWLFWAWPDCYHRCPFTKWCKELA